MPITTDVVSSNLDQGEMYNIKFVSDMRQVGGFLRVLTDFIHLRSNKTNMTIRPIRKNDTKYHNSNRQNKKSLRILKGVFRIRKRR